jgi:hypothetical protein
MRANRPRRARYETSTLLVAAPTSTTTSSAITSNQVARPTCFLTRPTVAVAGGGLDVVPSSAIDHERARKTSEFAISQVGSYSLKPEPVFAPR